ncbi:MAG: Hsp20/alpha crystallin family protein [Deltaproteobacteria bacterium]|nr:Hsp20/alpha crystallin family protein [Deltaproteobacteria bacterium]
MYLPTRRPIGSLLRGSGFKDVDDFFNDFFQSFDVQPRKGKGPNFSPTLDVVEDAEKYTVTAELPGMSENDIDVSVEADRLILKGHKKHEHQERDEKNSRYYFERSYGSFERIVPLAVEVDHDAIEASLKDGVLRLTLPKLPEVTEKTRKVSIKKS